MYTYCCPSIFTCLLRFISFVFFIYCTVAVSIGFINIFVIIANCLLLLQTLMRRFSFIYLSATTKTETILRILSVRISRVKLFLLFLPGVV